MADPVVTISPARVAVSPGGQATVTVTITNPGQIVEGYAVEVIDELGGAGPSSYAQVLAGDDPNAPAPASGAGSGGRPTVSVYPQARADVVIVFAPGSGPEVAGGVVVYGVRVTSTVDPDARAVAEAELDVGQVQGLSATLVPVTSTGRWQGRHILQVTNWGNSPTRLKLSAADPDELLGFLVRPDVVEVPVGGTASARVQVRTRTPRLRGQQTRLPFTVNCEPDPPTPRPPGPPGLPDPGRPSATGAFTQKPILSKGVVAVAGVAVAALVAGGLYAFLHRTPDVGATGGGAIPATPQLDPVTVAGPTALGVQWQAVANATGYELLQLASGSDAPSNSTELGADIRAQQVPDLQPGQEYCFQLRAVRDKVKSPLSEKACATTAPAGATGSQTSGPSGAGTETAGGPSSGASAGGQGAGGQGAGGQGAGGQGAGGSGAGGQGGGANTANGTNSTATAFAQGSWLVLVYVRPSDAPGAQDGLKQLQTALVARNAVTQLLSTADYPKLVPKLQPSYALALGPYSSQDAAAAACAPLKDNQDPLEDCLTVQPNP